ncbi:Putative transposase (ACLAME 33) [Azospirillum doebereinerae]
MRLDTVMNRQSSRPRAAASFTNPSLKGQRSGRGARYVVIRSTERLTDAAAEPSAGSIGDSDDNALAETINGLSRPR